MSIERIKNYIIENAQKEAEQIIKAAEGQFRNKIECAKLFLEKQYKEMLHTEEERLMEDMKSTLIIVKSDYKMKLLEMKNSVIDNILERAMSRIQSLSDGDYLTLIGRWLADIPDHLEGELFFNARDLQRITNVFIENIDKKRQTKIALSTNPIGIRGGFIVKTANYEIDCTLDTIVKNLRMTLIPKLSDMLRLSDTEF
ncbi:MAG: V-type ATP synthase subunit E [Planctomycetota bacterium]|nr:V-type ATP synthase subunit E [Planctomycetota bacterium]MDE2216082.1 V-type ATP synthase subunit E [Planctomycetota bacterium]